MQAKLHRKFTFGYGRLEFIEAIEQGLLDGPPAVKTAVDTWGPVPAIDLMRRVKEQFDPARSLAPGTSSDPRRL